MNVDSHHMPVCGPRNGDTASRYTDDLTSTTDSVAYTARVTEAERNIPTILTVFGATGDLMRRKVIPTLYYLHEKGQLPDRFVVIGFSRRELDDAGYRAFVVQTISEYRGHAHTAEELSDFLARFRFQRGDFDEVPSYAALKTVFDELDNSWRVCANKLFYLSVAPEFYETIFQHLSSSRLTEACSPEEGWTRVMVEKPFGLDSDTAKRLDMLLGQYFKEIQIYRIDHYLAKEMLQNILTFRFANNLFELSWGNELIERIDIRLHEEIGVEKRGAFYDAVGALRDVGQNHFLQILALLTMEHPKSFDAAVIQEKRAEALERVLPASIDKTVRAQYRGYRDIPGVAENSQTETYFQVEARLNDEKWSGVPIILDGGKRLGTARKEIVVTFRHPEPCLCPPEGPHHINRVIIRLEPKEEILIEFWSRRPGFGMETEPRMFHFLLREPESRVQYVEEYARLLLDCIRGDQSLFISTREVSAMWRFVDPILEAWAKGAVPLDSYEPGTHDILRA